MKFKVGDKIRYYDQPGVGTIVGYDNVSKHYLVDCSEHKFKEEYLELVETTEFELIYMSKVMRRHPYSNGGLIVSDYIYFDRSDFESESEAFKKWLELNISDVKRWGDYFTIDTKEIMRIKPL